MKFFRQRTFLKLRAYVLLALLVQSITGTGMLIKMATAQAAPVAVGFVVICTPEGLKNIALSDIDGEDAQTRHSCVCACCVLCGHCPVAVSGDKLVLVWYPRTGHLLSTTWQNSYIVPPPSHGLSIGNPRAPPAYS